MGALSVGTQAWRTAACGSAPHALWVLNSALRSRCSLQLVYGLFARLALTRSSNPLWQQVQPVLRQLLTFCEVCAVGAGTAVA